MSVEENTIKQSKLSKYFEVRKISEHVYEGIAPLCKPSESSRGVFGGNLCGQSLLVAMETVEEGFSPHSLHSYFLKSGDNTIPCQYHVEKVSDGKSFANRLIKVLQNNEVKYMIMVSLTKKNSHKDAIKSYNNSNKARAKSIPFDFQSSPPRQFARHHPDDLVTRVDHDHSKLLQHKFTPDYYNAKLVEKTELTKQVAERDLSFWIRVDDKMLRIHSHYQENLNHLKKYKYAGFGVILDSLHLTSLSRLLHLPMTKNLVSGGKGEHFFSVSLDHSIYFHDDEFDPTKWNFFHFKAPRFANNRVFLQGSYYNEDGKLFASIVQEGLVFFHGGSEIRAKL